MSSKSKRRVTVDPGNTVSEDSEKRKPSVFERLGPGAGQRKYPEFDNEREKKCRPFLLTGECPYGATCKYKHVQLSRKSRSREEDASPENLRLKLKGGPSERSGDKRRDSDSESRDPPARSSSHSRREKEAESGDRAADRPSRRDKETKIRSQVVVKKSENPDSEESGDDSESNWFSTLDYKKELELEQKRQQLQRELSQLAEEEVENITIQKKVPLSHSDSESSVDRGRPSKRVASPHDRRAASHDKRSTSPGGRSKKEKKKHRTKSPPEAPSLRDKKISSPPGPEKPREHKRKHEAEEESHKKHKKKKEKERKRSMSPPPPAAVARPKKKDKWGEEAESTASRSHADMSSSSRQHSQPHSKHSRSSSSDSSVSPPRSKDNKAKAKAKAKKKKSRAGKESDSDESHIKSKKWLSPLKKTLKLKKAKAMGGSGDAKVVEEERPPKQRSASPKASRRGDRPELMGEEPMLPSRSHESRRESDTARSRGHSSEKREKKVKGGRQSSESPAPLLDRSRGAKRGDSSRDTSFGRKGRQSESPVQQGDRSGSSRRGDNSRDLPYDRRKLDQRDRGESRKGVGDERSKRPVTPPLRQAEMYSPSQLDRDSPPREPHSRQQPSATRGRQGERGGDPLLREEERRSGQDREGRRGGEKFESRSSSASQDRGGGQERFGRRSDGDSFDQYGGQDRGQFDADRSSRYDYRDRGQEAGGD